MLYVSRRVGKDKFGIVDTDDGVEEVCSMQDIVAIASQVPDIDIKGITIRRVVYRGQSSIHIDRVEIYQNPSFSSTAQVKMRILRGIDIRTSNGAIVAISAPGHSSDTPIIVCLNDFGDKCGENILFGMSRNTDRPLVLVIKDGMQLRRNSLSGCLSFNVKIDITAVTDDKLVSTVYHTRAYRDDYGHDYSLLKSFIIDNPSRLDFYMGLMVVNRGKAKSSFLVESNFHNYHQVCRAISDYYRESIIGFCNSKIIWRTDLYGERQQKELRKVYEFYKIQVQVPVDEELPMAEVVLKYGAYSDSKSFKTMWACFKYFARWDDEYRRAISSFLREIRDWYNYNCHKWC